MLPQHEYMLGMHWLWWIFWAVLIAVFFWALARQIGLTRQPGAGKHRSESPEQILKRRYASGDITEDEYRIMLRRLKDEGERVTENH